MTSKDLKLKDRFGIIKLYPSLSESREWFSSWDNGTSKSFNAGEQDPEDSEFKMRGKGTIKIDGKGVAELSGDAPRMYIYDSSKPKWGNVEITFYGMRIDEYKCKSSQGFVAGARSEHQDSNYDPCLARTYYGRLLYDGRVNFKKELFHSDKVNINTSNKPSESSRVEWSTQEEQKSLEMPKDRWIGYKFIIRNIDKNSKVRLSLFLDLSEGVNGGSWNKLIEYVDDGNWQKEVPKCDHPNSQILLDPSTSVFVRNDLLISAKYMKFSIREIVAED